LALKISVLIPVRASSKGFGGAVLGRLSFTFIFNLFLSCFLYGFTVYHDRLFCQD
jgi:hypothetical protein